MQQLLTVVSVAVVGLVLLLIIIGARDYTLINLNTVVWWYTGRLEQLAMILVYGIMATTARKHMCNLASANFVNSLSYSLVFFLRLFLWPS